MTTVVETLNVARSQLGTVESPPNSNNVLYGRWYGMNNNPWCAMFVSWTLAQGGLGAQYRHAGVADSLATARNRGRHTGEFRAGFVACRINNGSWTGPGHTGLIEAVHSDGSVTTIEGNTSPGAAGSQRDGGGCFRRRRPKSYWNRQCIRIDYGGGTPPPPPPSPHQPPPPSGNRCVDSAGHPLLKQGATGPSVNHLQHLLRLGHHPISADGEFGPATRAAVINFQANQAHITADGEVGNETWTHLHRHIDGLTV